MEHFAIRAENFRGLRSLDWAVSGLVAIAGPAGSGKTTILSIGQLLRSIFERGIGPAVEFAGGIKDLKHKHALPEERVLLAIRVGSFDWEISPTLIGGAILEPLAERATGKSQLLFEQSPAINQLRFTGGSYQAHIRGSALKRMLESQPQLFREYASSVEAIENFRLYENLHLWSLRTEGSVESSDIWLHPTGRNAFSVLRNWQAGERRNRERLDFVRAGLSEAFPDLFEDFEFSTSQNIGMRFFFRGIRDSLPAFSAPNGLLVCLLQLMAVASTPDEGVVAIDEPENGLHPYAIRRVITLMRARAESRKLTILLGTHSPVVLNEFNSCPERLFVMERDEKTGAFAPRRATEIRDPQWLANFSLGQLYEHQEFGAQKKPPK